VNDYLREHPASCLFAALGCGVTAGFFSRHETISQEASAANPSRMSGVSRLMGATLLMLAIPFRRAILGPARRALAGAGSTLMKTAAKR
jgi:uncharacterized membrane protein